MNYDYVCFTAPSRSEEFPKNTTKKSFRPIKCDKIKEGIKFLNKEERYVKVCRH